MERSVIIILSISFKKEKDLALPPLFVWVPFLVGFCISPQPHKRTQGPLALCRGALCSPWQAQTRAGGPSAAVPFLERTCPPPKELVTASGLQTRFCDQQTGACVFRDPAQGTEPYFPEPYFPIVV